MWIMNIPVISTGHLTETTCNNLDQFKEQLLFAEYEHGVFIYIGDDEANIVDDFPDDLKALMRFMQSQSFTWVRLDSVGDEIDDLQHWEW